MLSPRMLAIAIAAATASLGLVGCAQTPVEQDASQRDAMPAAGMPMPMGGSGAPMARMNEQMRAMQAMHDQMMQAKTPEQRSALMAEHMKVMQDSLAAMGGMGSGGMMGKGGMGSMGGMHDKTAAAGEKGSMPGMQGMQGMKGKGAMEGDMGMHHQMMEKRMQMMQSMMQMMMDRMPSAPGKP